ncbi:hypothetical protein BSQ39_00845 [Loigolactobacillus backii]|nr:hypothetical protein BSQ39_00845 [Loigolactobacillus backii]
MEQAIAVPYLNYLPCYILRCLYSFHQRRPIMFKKIFAGLFIVCLLTLTGYSLYVDHTATNQPQTPTTINKDFQASATPTLFVHGWLGGGFTFNPMINQLAAKHAGGKVMTVTVSTTGPINYYGHLNKKMANPIIQIVFKRNSSFYRQEAHWLQQILVTLHKRYGVTSYNAVGHSWGGNALVNQLLLDSNASTPKLHTLVLLGAPIDGAMHEGTPFATNNRPTRQSKNYRRLVARKSVLKRNRAIRIFNVYSTLDGKLTDGAGANTQAQAMRYLVQGRVDHYQEQKLADLTHSQLHSKGTVTNLIAHDLWQH